MRMGGELGVGGLWWGVEGQGSVGADEVHRGNLRLVEQSAPLHPKSTTPPPKSAKKSQQIGEQIGGPIFRQNRLPVPWISVPDP